jgi:ubiquinone/menaquinone biosynthesis C-methylase UbiE
VLAVDEQPELLDRLRAKLASHPGTGVETVLSVGGRVPLDDGVADRMLIVNVLHHVDDDPGALGEISRLLAPGGLLVAAEFARMDRPVGPSNDHVLPLDDVRALLTGAGLQELALYAPGSVGLYHNVILAEKPRP